MLNSLKKLAGLLLALLMLLSCAVAAAEEEHGPLWIDNPTGATLTWWVPIDSTSAQYFETWAEHPFFLWMEEQTGVHVDFIHPSYEQMDQQFNLMITSGSYYDILYYASAPDGPQAAVTDGLFADIAEFESLMPNYFAALRCGDGSFSAWEWGPEKELYWQGAQPSFLDMTTTVQGNIWCVSQIWTDRLSTECGALIRKDWLDDAGLDIPTTIEELEVVLEAFKARGDDVIPMSLGQQGCNSTDGYLTAAFDFNGWFNVRDGVVQPVCWTTEEGEAYVRLMRDWYAKGYIDPDFLNRDSESLEALFLSDRLGLYAETWSDHKYYENSYVGADEDFAVVPLPPVRMTEDQQLRYVQTYTSEPTNYSCIAGPSPNRELAAQWLDRLFSKEAILRGQYGVEGESYVLDENGVPYYTEWFYENMDEQELIAAYLMPNVTGYWSTRANAIRNAPEPTIESQKTQISAWYQDSSVWGTGATGDMIIGYVTFDGAGWSEMYDPYVEAETYAMPMVLKMIIGTEDIEQFDAMAQKALDMGWREARDLMQVAYNQQHQQPEGYGMDD